jgi:hypothetical protein
MASIPDFSETVESFQAFLASNSLPTAITWVFRNDTWFVAHDKLIARSDPDGGNASLAAKVYAEGQAKGLVEIVAIGRTPSQTLVTIWFPKFPEDEVQGWSVGLKLAIRQPCPVARRVGGVFWRFLQWSPAFKRYQRDHGFIGTKEWAAD